MAGVVHDLIGRMIRQRQSSAQQISVVPARPLSDGIDHEIARRVRHGVDQLSSTEPLRPTVDLAQILEHGFGAAEPPNDESPQREHLPRD